MNTNAEGVTVAPIDKDGRQPNECMGRWKHSVQWVWEPAVPGAALGVWTDRVRCSTCGAEWQVKRFKGQ